MTAFKSNILGKNSRRNSKMILCCFHFIQRLPFFYFLSLVLIKEIIVCSKKQKHTRKYDALKTTFYWRLNKTGYTHTAWVEKGFFNCLFVCFSIYCLIRVFILVFYCLLLFDCSLILIKLIKIFN